MPVPDVTRIACRHGAIIGAKVDSYTRNFTKTAYGSQGKEGFGIRNQDRIVRLSCHHCSLHDVGKPPFDLAEIKQPPEHHHNGNPQ